MRGNVIPQRMQNTTLGVGLPVIAFELIAGMAAIDKIIQSVTAALRTRLKMVYRQFGSGVNFADAAVAAAKVVLSA